MKRLSFFSLLFILFVSCNMEKKIIRFYDKKKNLIDSIVGSSKNLYERYAITKATFRYNRDNGRIQCNFFIDGSNISIGMLAVPGSYALENFPNELNPERDFFKSLRNDKDIVSLLQNYMQTKAKALKLTWQGVFFAIGSPVYIKHPDYEGGVYVSYSNVAVKKEAKQIRPNVFILDDRV